MCYTYNAEDVRIRNLCADEDTAYTYNTNCKLSKLLCKTTNGVVTDSNGLIYMRARYYSPEIRRFINADIIPGEISNAITLNRYAYANGNPVSFVDPLIFAIIAAAIIVTGGIVGGLSAGIDGGSALKNTAKDFGHLKI